MKNKKKILVVDDDMDYLFQMEVNLQQMGFETLSAESQKEAEKIITGFKPDLCILDLMMESDDSGFILCYKIKKLYPDVPIILVTAVTAETGMSFDVKSNENQQWIRADLFLDKGIRKDQLQHEIKKLLGM